MTEVEFLKKDEGEKIQMNKFKFRYVFKDTTSKLIIFEYFTIEEIENDEVNEFISSESAELGSIIELIERNRYTGFTDSSDAKIYVGDVIEYLGYEVKDGRQIYPKRRMIVEDKLSCLSRLSFITSGLKGIIIGNIYVNPELVEKK